MMDEVFVVYDFEGISFASTDEQKAVDWALSYTAEDMQNTDSDWVCLTRYVNGEPDITRRFMLNDDEAEFVTECKGAF